MTNQLSFDDGIPLFGDTPLGKDVKNTYDKLHGCHVALNEAHDAAEAVACMLGGDTQAHHATVHVGFLLVQAASIIQVAQSIFHNAVTSA